MKIQVLLVFFAFPFAFKPRAKGSIKKIRKTLLILVLLVTFNGIAQQDNIQREPSNEIKLNAFNLVVFKAVDLSYEYILNENQSLGVGILFKIASVEGRDKMFYEPEISYNRNFSITPYYRRYFSKKHAKGLFIEGFVMYASGKEFEETPDSNYPMLQYISEKYKKLRFGLGIGLKIVIRKSIAIDINFGLDLTWLVPYIDHIATINPITRGGISIGYRF